MGLSFMFMVGEIWLVCVVFWFWGGIPRVSTRGYCVTYYLSLNKLENIILLPR